jgi:hypothetical protein
MKEQNTYSRIQVNLGLWRLQRFSYDRYSSFPCGSNDPAPTWLSGITINSQVPQELRYK